MAINATGATLDSSITFSTSLLAESMSMGREPALRALGDSFLTAPEHVFVAGIPTAAHEASRRHAVSSHLLSRLPDFTGPEHWHVHIGLLCHALRNDHPAARNVVFEHLDDMQIAGLVPKQRSLVLMPRSVLAAE
ncbi:hypothetical protein LTR37_003395 [Vermiconidia calcicola]|uniref:Uncharacterized protein n=1 Tax=Vermiconidia calcicola TaxID=1690605 RepID=A0ACC3NRX5_9PEZI|nr:hypothetical protein LTR37_003395 [Vermiconidia calcicola]